MALAAIQMLAKKVTLDTKMAVTVNTPKNKRALLWVDFRGTDRLLWWLEKCKKLPRDTLVIEGESQHNDVGCSELKLRV
jgi:hypothetical protein